MGHGERFSFQLVAVTLVHLLHISDYHIICIGLLIVSYRGVVRCKYIHRYRIFINGRFTCYVYSLQNS